MTETPSATDASGAPRNMSWVWAGAGFVLMLLAGAVVWLAVIVADLRAEPPTELVVVEQPASATPEPMLRTPKSTAAPGAGATAASASLSPSLKPASEVDTPPVPQNHVIHKTAGELGMKGVPADQLVEVVVDGEYNPGRDVVGTADGFVSRKAFEDEGYKMNKYPLTKPEFRAGLAEKFPETSTPLTPDEVSTFGDVLRQQYRSEAALLHVLKGNMAQEDIGPILEQLGRVMQEKWEQVSPASSPEDFARADAAVMRQARASFGSLVADKMEESLRTGAAFEHVPGEDELQEIAWVARSLMNKGLFKTVRESDDMRDEVNVPPPPPGVLADDPEYVKYAAEYRKQRQGMQDNVHDGRR